MSQTLGMSDRRSRLPSRMAFSKIFIYYEDYIQIFFRMFFWKSDPEMGLILRKFTIKKKRF